MKKEDTAIFGAKNMIKQIDEESSQCSWWMISSINNYLSVNPTMSLLEFRRELAKIIPETNDAFVYLKKEKDIKTVN